MEWYYAEGEQQRGPVPEEELSRLVEEGTVTTDTLIWCPAMTDWRTFGEVRAAGSLLQTHEMNAGQLTRPAEQENATEPLAIASLVLAIVSWGCGTVVAIAAIVCGHIALNRINTAEGRLAGRPLALGGLIIGYFSLAFRLLAMLFGLLIFATNR